MDETHKKKEIKINEEQHLFFLEESDLMMKLYKYNKDIHEEISKNILVKYDADMIDFLLNNQITLEEIKELNNIILFPIEIPVYLNLSKYSVNIIDFFKYVYSQPYEYIDSDFCYNYYLYLKENKDKINKYNKFPHNPSLVYDILKNKKIIRNDKKDIIIDINDFHLEFYGSKCKYYITYNKRKYSLLNKKDRKDIIAFFMYQNEKKYLSEYYKHDSLDEIIASFSDKKYYTQTIKEDVFYILKDNYKTMTKEEINKIQKIILRNKKPFQFIKKDIFTNNFKKNLLLLNYLTNYYLYESIEYILKYKYIFNNKNIKFLDTYSDCEFRCYKTNKIIYKDDIEIKKINILDLTNLINENEYLDKKISDLFYRNIYLCIDEKSGDKIFVYKVFEELEEKNIIKYLNKEYSQDFLERVEKLRI